MRVGAGVPITLSQVMLSGCCCLRENPEIRLAQTMSALNEPRPDTARSRPRKASSRGRVAASIAKGAESSVPSRALPNGHNELLHRAGGQAHPERPSDLWDRDRLAQELARAREEGFPGLDDSPPCSVLGPDGAAEWTEGRFWGWFVVSTV